MKARAGLVVVLLIAGLGTAGCISCPQALNSGTLKADGANLGFERVGFTEVVGWPVGHSVRDQGGVLVLVDLFGNVVAREGDAIQMGGGAGADGVFKGCGEIVVTFRRAG